MQRVVSPRLVLLVISALTFAVGSVADPQDGHAKSPWAEPVGRATSDRDADLIEALVRLGRFDDALSICLRSLAEADPRSDQAARWAAAMTRIATARQMGTDRFEESDLQAASQPIDDLLRGYPQHRRRLFLQAERIAAQRQQAFHSVLRAAVSTSDAAASDTAVRRLLRSKNAIDSMASDVADERSMLDGRRREGDEALADDLARLQQRLLIDAVSLALMQTDLFPRGSADRIAAAAKAEQAAAEAIGRLPSDTPARLEVERLRVEAILRSDQFAGAAQALEQLTRAVGQPTPARIQAMHVRLDLASGRIDQAGARLVAFFGEQPASAPNSFEMDLARLQFLLVSGQNVGRWLDAIGQRGGAYARRRAEALSLASLRRRGSSDPGTSPMVEPSLIAVEGQELVRGGQPGRGGDMLSAAAAAEQDPNKAILHASAAAAALVAAGRKSDAVRVLVDTALAKPAGNNAADAHLQAILLVSKQDGVEGTAAKIESMLRTQLETWPSSDSAPASRKWLQKTLIGQDRIVEAAEVATNIPVDQVQDDDIQRMTDLWRTAFRSEGREPITQVSERFLASFQPLSSRPSLRRAFRLSAALLIDRDALVNLPAADGNDDPFADALLQFRDRNIVTEPLEAPPNEYLDDATWRLMRDGRADPKCREPVARLLTAWDSESDPSLERAERLIWLGDSDAAIAMIRDLTGKSPDSIELTRRAAELLATGGATERDESIRLWDRLASGSRQGSDLWHEAKLSAIELLAQQGKQADAAKRAKYILLTVPKMDQRQRGRYEAAAQ